MSSENIKKAFANLEKRYGKGVVSNFSEDSKVDIERISCGSIGLNVITGGGYPKGRIIEIYGPESSGKTTLCLHAMVECQKTGKAVAMIDAEQSFDPNYASGLGLVIEDGDKFIFSQPDNGEQAFEVVEELIKTGEVGMIIVDSVAALVPKAEIEGDFGASKMGLQARLMSQAMRKLVSLIKKSDCIVIFTNQLRENIGVMFGNPETTTGGNALKFYASIRLDIRKYGLLKDGDEVFGVQTRVKCIKNKVAPPFKKAEFDIVFGKGISRSGEVLTWAVDLELIKKSGSWYSYGTTRLGQGAEGVRQLLEENPDLLKELETKILELL